MVSPVRVRVSPSPLAAPPNRGPPLGRASLLVRVRVSPSPLAAPPNRGPPLGRASLLVRVRVSPSLPSRTTRPSSSPSPSPHRASFRPLDTPWRRRCSTLRPASPGDAGRRSSRWPPLGFIARRGRQRERWAGARDLGGAAADDDRLGGVGAFGRSGADVHRVAGVGGDPAVGARVRRDEWLGAVVAVARDQADRGEGRRRGAGLVVGAEQRERDRARTGRCRRLDARCRIRRAERRPAARRSSRSWDSRREAGGRTITRLGVIAARRSGCRGCDHRRSSRPPSCRHRLRWRRDGRGRVVAVAGDFTVEVKMRARRSNRGRRGRRGGT